MATVTKRPAFRKPWQHGAKAYHEADSLDAISGGLGRLRSPLTVLIRHETHSLDGVPCSVCGEDLAAPYTARPERADDYAMVDVNPRTKHYAVRHYYCAWGVTMGNVMKLREVMGC